MAQFQGQFIVFCSLFWGYLFADLPPDPALTVVNLNLRYNNPDDGKNRWENRIPLVKAFLAESAVDLLGFQEVTHRQLLDLQRIMRTYESVGQGRADGLTKGEYNPIFYKKDRFELLESGTFWLSETPSVPGSIGWDAQLPRIVTWAKLYDLASGKTLLHVNTHFDNKGTRSRFESIALLSARIRELAGNLPVIATSDFNIRKDHPRYGSKPYLQLIKTLKEDLNMESSEFLASGVISAGATGNGFEADWQLRPPHAVDYIFVNEKFIVHTYEVRHLLRDGIFIADHWPVIAKIAFSH
ncbi:endonuclease/exonuclease/phosphatase family protein [Cyclobacterium xiamenense]|uniref:endonuclease/exonuclease/phosphatase family protein n=1 Tax=Cyclobacterium xiamenense TaxID=1297121 RepID=UPI0035D046E0